MSSKSEHFQITQQLRVFFGRINRAEREQQTAIAALQQARCDTETAADALVLARTQLANANAEFAASAASEQARIWRDTTNQRQTEAEYHFRQCELSEEDASSALHAANRALQKLQLQNDQILARKAALTKAKLKRQEAGVEDDRNAASARGSVKTAISL